LHTEGGNEIFDPEENKPFLQKGLHVHSDRTENIADLLVKMVSAIFFENWGDFDDLRYKLEELKPSRKVLDAFALEQMRDVYVRHLSPFQINILRGKLNLIGVKDEVLDEGFNDSAYGRNQRGIREELSKWPPMQQGKRILAVMSQRSESADRLNKLFIFV